jgi:hypothetical protein
MTQEINYEFNSLNNNLDNKWIDEFEKTDKLYQGFYKENNYYVNVHYVYINKNSEIEKIREHSVYMSKPNYILRDEILGLIKRNSIDNDKRYTLLSILKINITLDPNEIKEFLVEEYIDFYKDKFCSVVKNIDNILFEQTINMFQDLNDIIILFFEKSNTNINLNTVTKKIYLNTKLGHKKTIKKQYKDN